MSTTRLFSPPTPDQDAGSNISSPRYDLLPTTQDIGTLESIDAATISFGLFLFSYCISCSPSTRGHSTNDAMPPPALTPLHPPLPLALPWASPVLLFPSPGPSLALSRPVRDCLALALPSTCPYLAFALPLPAHASPVPLPRLPTCVAPLPCFCPPSPCPPSPSP